MQAYEHAAEGLAGMLAGGIVGLISGIIALIEGIISIKASKNNKFGGAAFIFAIFGLIGSVSSSITSISGDGSASGILSAVISIAISVLILLAANKVRQARKSEQI